MALQVGILVALTQQIPEHQVLLFGVVGTRVKVLCFPAIFWIMDSQSYLLETSYALCHSLQHSVHHWLPIAVDSDPVRVARFMDLLTLLQTYWRRYHRSGPGNMGRS